VLSLRSTQENAFTEDDLSFLGQVANQIALAVDNALAYGQISQLKDRFAREDFYLRSEIRGELHFEDIVGSSQALHLVLSEIETVASADSTVLICGETGTGKELITRPPQPQLAEVERLRQTELRGDSYRAARERALRPSERSFHRCDFSTDRSV
jgi:transcriptional regulator of acetoin/glycerol metabolism